MGVSAGTRTISDGLVLALDAANTRSYPGSGTTWTDLSGRGNNGTLTNGPSFVRPTFREPFGGAGSVYFDGSGDYLTFAPQQATAFGTGDFTVECWVYANNTNNYFVIDNRNSSQTGTWAFLKNNNTLEWFSGSSSLITTFSSFINTWVHIAYSRNGTTGRLFINGTVSGTWTDSTNYSVSSTLAYIGSRYTATDQLNGYFSNLRVINGTALYTQNFTPKRESFVTQSSPYTSLLTCQNGTIRDASPNNFTITRVGNVTPVSYAPYISFDGTNDYITIPVNSNFDFGTGDLTIESWVYITSLATYHPLLEARVSATYQNYVFGIYNIGGTLRLDFVNAGGVTGRSATTTSVPLNQWTHVAFVKNGSVTSYYVNGVKDATTNSYAGSLTPTTSSTIFIGAVIDPYYFNGSISNLRILKGKGLTAEEVLQNYQNTKSRYGL